MSCSVSDMTFTNRWGSLSFLPMWMNLILCSMRSFCESFRNREKSSIRNLTSVFGLLIQFSVESPQRVRYLMLNFLIDLRRDLALSAPFWCPAIGGSPCSLAHLLLPSGIMARCFSGYWCFMVEIGYLYYKVFNKKGKGDLGRGAKCDNDTFCPTPNTCFETHLDLVYKHSFVYLIPIFFSTFPPTGWVVIFLDERVSGQYCLHRGSN